MQYNEYPKTPKVGLHITSVVIAAILCAVFLQFVNPAADLSPESRRAINRIGAMLLMVSGMLGGVGVLSFRDIKKKRALSQANLQTYTASVKALEAQVRKTPDLKLSLQQQKEFLSAAKSAKDDVDRFDETASKIGMWGLGFLVLGTLALEIAA